MVFSVIGWTIIHSLWQCLGLFAGLKLVLGLVDLRRSDLRYGAALGALGLAVVGVLGTFVWEWRAFVPAAAVGGFGAVAPVVGVKGIVSVEGAGPGYSVFSWLTKISPYLTMGWITGVLFYTGRLVLSGMAVRRVRRLPGMPDAAVEGMLEGLRLRMGVLRPVRLLITDRVAEPMTFGFLRAVVVLPLSYVSQVPAEQLEMILAHELAHIRRRDYLVNIVQSVFDALLFFNPFFRTLSTIVREEREYRCDDLAAFVAGDRRAMAVTLTNLGLLEKGLALGLFAAPKRKSLYRRVMRLIEPSGRPVLSVRAALLGCFGALAVVAVLTQCSRSVMAQTALPVKGDQLNQLYNDNQAGYKEQVFSYSKAGQLHDILLVRTQDEKTPVFAYYDGRLLSPMELEKLLEVVQDQRKMVYLIRFDGKKGDSMKVQHGSRDSVKFVRLDSVKLEVNHAMEQYKIDVQGIPDAVRLHEVVTKIVTEQVYTPEQRSELMDLLQKRGVDAIKVEGAPNPPPR
jgi:beta-lactamase regulating signal transducer with metallopeptidase domain